MNKINMVNPEDCEVLYFAQRPDGSFGVAYESIESAFRRLTPPDKQTPKELERLKAFYRRPPEYKKRYNALLDEYTAEKRADGTLKEGIAFFDEFQEWREKRTAEGK